MKIEALLESLLCYAMNQGLAQPEDHTVLLNRLLEVLRIDSYEPSAEPVSEDIEEILGGILDYAVQKGLCEDDITSRDLFDTKIMGILTPMPREVIARFNELYAQSPVKATDWYYTFSCATDYIRTYRIQKDMRWKYQSPHGLIDITINLSKPEKDPKAIAAAKLAPQSAYPKCQLCTENEGYAGRINHPARQNHRIIPIKVAGADWCLQYSPYVYYNEHCIVFNKEHTPMKIDASAFRKLLSFVEKFPHYFVGSNADLPIVGGSILSHEHFQGGHYTFAMEQAPIEKEIHFSGYEDITAGIVAWPMSLIRLNGADPERIVSLADKILSAWRNYSDAGAEILAYTGEEPHNTITPIARRRGENYELDLVLRNNRTTQEHPLGLFHPHADKHNIKKENIGLIEVMGLAVLPSRLKKELYDLAEAIVSRKDISSDPVLGKHAQWVEDIKSRVIFTAENAMDVLMEETGRVFYRVLEDAGVYKCTPEGREAFLRFVESV